MYHQREAPSVYILMTRPKSTKRADARRNHEKLLTAAGELFAAIAAGQVTASVNQTFRLAEAAEAHRALEGRRTTGASVLLP